MNKLFCKTDILKQIVSKTHKWTYSFSLIVSLSWKIVWIFYFLSFDDLVWNSLSWICFHTNKIIIKYSRGPRNALFSLADAEWHMSIKNGQSPALQIFFYCFSNFTVRGTSLSRRQFDSSRVMPGLLLESIWCKTQNQWGKQCITDDLPWCI